MDLIFKVTWDAKADYLTACFNNGSGSWDGIDRRIQKPASFPAEVWVKDGDATIYKEIPIDIVPPKVKIVFSYCGN